MFRLFFCNCLCLLLFTIKLLYLLLLFYRQRYLRIGKTAKFTTLQFCPSLKIAKSNTREIWVFAKLSHRELPKHFFP